MACEERDRLRAAYQTAMKDKYALESQVVPKLVSENSNERTAARKQLHAAAKRSGHMLHELWKHEKRHGCR